MNNEINVYYYKLTIFKLIDQCCYRCMKDDKPAFYNLCESAFEWAFNALGFEDDVILAEDFYKQYDEAWAQYGESIGWTHPVSMLEMFQDRKEPWVYSWEYEDLDEEEIAIKSGYINYSDGGY